MFYTINRTYRNALYKKAPTINFNISGYYLRYNMTFARISL